MDSNTAFQVSGSAAEFYENILVPVIFIPWANNLLGRADLKPETSLLDVACGTGIVARMARERIGPKGRVVGADLNPDMLATARQISEGANIEWVLSDAANMPFDDDSFDVLTIQQGLQFFPDKPAAVTECLRVLKPGGMAVMCMVADIEDNPLISAQFNALDKRFGPEVSGSIRAVCGLSDADEIATLFNSAGFKDVDIQRVTLPLHHPDGVEFSSGFMMATPAAGAVAALPEDERAQIVKEILDGFGDCFDGKALNFPHISHVVTARA